MDKTKAIYTIDIIELEKVRNYLKAYGCEVSVQLLDAIILQKELIQLQKDALMDF